MFLAESKRKNNSRKVIDRKNIEQNYLNVVGNIVLALDKQFKIAFLNKKGYEILGYDEGDLKGKNWEGLLPPEERNEIRKLFDDWAQEKSIMPVHNENDVVTKSGEKRRISWHNVELKDEKGQLIGILSSGEDVTERKKAEKELEESKERLEVAQRIAHVGSWEYFVKNDQAVWSKELFHIFGLEPKPKAPNIAEYGKLIHSDDLEKVVATMDNLLAKGKLGETISFDYRITEPDGAIRYLHTERMVKEVNEEGKASRIVGIDQDITERKKVEIELELYQKHLERLVEEKTDQLKKAERLAAIGETAGMVGHDIRNPLQAIISDVYLLKEAIVSMSEGKSKQDAIESLDSIENNIDYINKIVADLQDYYKLLKPEHVDINLYELSINVLKPMNIPDNIDRIFEIDQSIRLKSDPTLITRILSNLITNAVQAMPSGGKLFIKAYRIGDKAAIEITDTGVGIPEQIKNRLFTPMFTTKAKGQGLGLAVVKRLVDALNGTISFESQEGKGAKFIIQLPLN
jgi:PAS domain S-box-containing protein